MDVATPPLTRAWDYLAISTRFLPDSFAIEQFSGVQRDRSLLKVMA